MTNSLLFISIECFVSANCSTPFYHSIARCERLLWESTLSAGMSPIRHACQLLDTCISLTTQIGTSVPTNVFNTLQNTSLNRGCQIASFTPKPDNWCPFACVIRPYHHANFTSPHLLIPESKPNFWCIRIPHPVFPASSPSKFVFSPLPIVAPPSFSVLLSHSHYILNADPTATSSRHSSRSTSISARVRMRASWRRTHGSARLHGRGCQVTGILLERW
jgi:hypothetical protein